MAPSHRAEGDLSLLFGARPALTEGSAWSRRSRIGAAPARERRDWSPWITWSGAASKTTCPLRLGPGPAAARARRGWARARQRLGGRLGERPARPEAPG